MRTPAQRGRYGRWLVAAREGKGYDTAEKALKALAAAGITIGKSTYAEYESGSKVPSRNHLPLLEQFWGAAPSSETDPEASDLAAAIRQQAEAISALAAQVKALVEGQPSPDELAHAMGQAVGLAVREALRAAGRDVVPQLR